MNKSSEKEQKDIIADINSSSFEMELPKKKEVVAPLNNDSNKVIDQQTIIINNQELSKKYGYYDEIRRKTLGVINSLELGVVEKDNLDRIVQECVIKAPNYWLTYAMSALAYWYMDKKSYAEKSLIKAIECDDQKTSFFFSLITSRSNRNSAAIKWLKRYFIKVDPYHLDNQIILLIDVVSLGYFGNEAKAICSSHLKKWIKELSKDNQIINNAKELWKKYFNSFYKSTEANDFPFLKISSPDFLKIIEVLSMADTNREIYSKIVEIVEKKSTKKISVNKLIDQLINYPDDGEKEIIQKNLTDKYETNNFIFIASLELISNNQIGSVETRKLIMSLLKNIIIESFNEYKKMKWPSSLPEIRLVINKWQGITTDASNEKTLMADLNKSIDVTIIDALKATNYINIPIILVPLALIIISVVLRNNLFISILLCVAAGAFILGSIYLTDKKRNNHKNDGKDVTTGVESILNNIMAEVVDYSRIWSESNMVTNDIENYLDSLVIDNYENTKEVI